MNRPYIFSSIIKNSYKMRFFIVHFYKNIQTRKTASVTDDIGLETELKQIVEYNRNPPNEHSSILLMPFDTVDYHLIKNKFNNIYPDLDNNKHIIHI